MDEPPLLPLSPLFLSAFMELTTERQIGMGLGPIPWSAILLYAERKNLDPGIHEAFVHVIRAMDSAYLDWQQQESERRQRQARG